MSINSPQPIRYREAMIFPYERPEAFQPTNNYEMFLIEQMADNQFRLNRAHQIECGHMDLLTARDKNAAKLSDLHHLTDVMEKSVESGKFLEFLIRYRNGAERGIRRAQATLLAYRASRPQPTPPQPDVPEVRNELSGSAGPRKNPPRPRLQRLAVTPTIATRRPFAVSSLTTEYPPEARTPQVSAQTYIE